MAVQYVPQLLRKKEGCDLSAFLCIRDVLLDCSAFPVLWEAMGLKQKSCTLIFLFTTPGLLRFGNKISLFSPFFLLAQSFQPLFDLPNCWLHDLRDVMGREIWPNKHSLILSDANTVRWLLSFCFESDEPSIYCCPGIAVVQIFLVCLRSMMNETL